MGSGPELRVGCEYRWPVLLCFRDVFWSFWPGELPVTAVNFNWSGVIFGTVFILSLIMYVVKGRKEYSGPAVDVKRED